MGQVYKYISLKEIRKNKVLDCILTIDVRYGKYIYVTVRLLFIVISYVTSTSAREGILLHNMLALLL